MLKRNLLGIGLSIVTASTLFAGTTIIGNGIQNITLKNNKVIIETNNGDLNKISVKKLLAEIIEDKNILSKLNGIDDIFLLSYLSDKIQFATKEEKRDKNFLMRNFADDILEMADSMKAFTKVVENSIDIKKSSSSSARKLRAKIKRRSNTYKTKYFNVDFRQGMDFGTSLNTLNNDIQNATMCLNGFTVNDPIFRGDKTYKFKVAKSLKDIEDALHIDASISIEKAGMSGTLSGAYDTYSKKLNDSVVVIVEVQYEAYDYSLKGPKLTEGDITKLYQDAGSYEKFRSKCGDRYLSTITTGGRYTGLITISSSSSEEKEAIKAHLEGHYDNGAINADIEGNLDLKSSEILKSENITIEIFSKGGKGSNKLIKDLDAFYASAETFMNTFDELDPTDPKGYTTSAFLAKFDDYGSTTMAVQGSSIEEQREVKNEYVNYASTYSDIINKIDFIMTNYHLFVNGETKDEAMMAMKKKLMMKNSQLRYMNMLCSRKNPLTRKCVLVTDLAKDLDTSDPIFATLEETKFPTEWELRDELPMEKVRYPRTCTERRNLFPSLSKVDADYRVYMEGDKLQPYDIYCKGMADTTTTPQEYLTLKNLSPISDHPSYNYSRLSKFKDSLGVDTDLISIYEKLKVKISFDHLAVYDTQPDFFKTVADGGITNIAV